MNARLFKIAAPGVFLLLATLLGGPAGAEPAPADAAGTEKPEQTETRLLAVVLYPGFELLDVCGPAEMFGSLGNRMRVITVGEQEGPVASTQGPRLVADYTFVDCPQVDLILVPGGFGTFAQLDNAVLLDWLKNRAAEAEIVTSVCSGASILAKAGLLDDRRATTNKQFYSVCTAQGPNVEWVKEARWVDDGNIVTSSGVSAGMDMALHVIARLYGTDVAEGIANGTEYQWHRDADVDPFAKFAK
ncbi:MAG: DJ-1/PfpI family protein [Pirellulales bacterium]